MPTTWLGGRWTWQNRLNATLILLICAGLVAFLGLSVVSNYQAASDAVTSLNRARELTARRIDKLNNQIDQLSTQNAKAQRQRGLLLAEVRALTRQLEALGVAPVATAPSFPHSTTVVVHPTTVTTVRPRPTVTKTRSPKPTPKPEPTTSCLLGIKTALTCTKK